MILRKPEIQPLFVIELLVNEITAVSAFGKLSALELSPFHKEKTGLLPTARANTNGIVAGKTHHVSKLVQVNAVGDEISAISEI